LPLSTSLLYCDCHIRAGLVTHLACNAGVLIKAFGIVIAFAIDVFGKADDLFGAGYDT
jgi:hypothetical protein